MDNNLRNMPLYVLSLLLGNIKFSTKQKEDIIKECYQYNDETLDFSYVQELDEKYYFPYTSIFAPLLKQIETKFNDFDDKRWLRLTTFWGHIMKPNASINLHNHIPRIATHDDWNICGTYYLKVPKDSGDISFVWTEIGTSKKREHRITPEEDMLIFYPPNLEHYVSKNNSEEDRLSFSFNGVCSLLHGTYDGIMKDGFNQYHTPIPVQESSKL